MKGRAIMLSGLLGFCALALAIWMLSTRTSPRVSGPLAHEVYVWQRAWTPPVRQAVMARGSNFVNLIALAAEISWQERQPRVIRVAVDYPTLANAGCPVGLALRIGPYGGPFGAGTRTSSPAPASTTRPTPQPGDELTDYLCELAASLVGQAKSNDVKLSELQIDFDSAESKLDGYRLWVEAIQRRLAPLPVTITALPSWLNSPAFPRLAAAATNYVLQVHSVNRPRSMDARFSLCDPRATSRAVERAGRLGVPFRVALPTYGYLLAFTADGQFHGLSAEGPRPNWPDSVQLREVHSDPIALASLVRHWTHERPAALTGVIWYRLPVTTDSFNWRWSTLGAIVAARVPQAKLQADARRVEAGLVEIGLVNAGELDISSRLAVEVRWSQARLVAGDGLRDFELVEADVSAARFQSQTAFSRLPAGDRLTIGWLRFDRDCEVQCEVRKLGNEAGRTNPRAENQSPPDN